MFTKPFSKAWDKSKLEVLNAKFKFFLKNIEKNLLEFVNLDVKYHIKSILFSSDHLITALNMLSLLLTEFV